MKDELHRQDSARNGRPNSVETETGPEPPETAEGHCSCAVTPDDMVSWLRANGWTWIVATDDDFPDLVTAEVWRDGFANLGRTYTAPTLHAALEAAVQAIHERKQ